MGKETFEQQETTYDAEPAINHVQKSTYNKMLMILAIIGSSFAYGCSPKLTKAPQSICGLTSKKCEKCLNDLMDQKLEDHDCLKQEVDILAQRSKPPRKLCKLRHPSSVYTVNHCDDSCKNLKNQKEICTFKVTRYRLKVLERVQDKFRCLIAEYKKKKEGKKYSLKKCKIGIIEPSKTLTDECGKK